MKESVIMEIRAGAGGDEAALFVGDLVDMYTKFSQQKGFKVVLLDSSPTPLGGYKSVSFQITGENAWKLFRHEGGVHRVQRVPETERGGRVHTSTVTVAVLKKAEKKEVNIQPSDLKIDFFKSSGPGGQNVNKRETAVRITHTPTGAVAESQASSTQQANRETAMSILRSKVLQKIEADRAAKQQNARTAQIGTGDRAEKIRTYNFPQNRLTDHRINKKWHNLDKIIGGELDKVLKTVGKQLS